MTNPPLNRVTHSIVALALSTTAGAALTAMAPAAAANAAAPPATTPATAPATTTYAPTDDTYTSSTKPLAVNGAATRLMAGRINGATSVSYLKFKVTTDVRVLGARITLTRDEHHLPATVRIAAVANTSWSARTLTAQTAPAIGATLDTASPTATTVAVTFDVSKAIRGPGTYAFAITSPVTNDVARFRSTEYGTDAPALTLSLVPPATPKPIPIPSLPNPNPNPTKPAGPCTVNAKLVPSCGILWGAAAGGFAITPRDAALRTWEAKSGRTASIYHTYHRGDELFPTAAEIAMTREPGKPRVLMLNWKVDYGTTWANVAAGGQDPRIDRLAAYLKATYTDPFFLVLHHEPENDVNQAAGSGMTAKDFAAMFRHTAARMKADGVGNAVFTVAYMNIEKWNDAAWWPDLYPGDDAVDWIGLDSYVSSEPGGYHYGDLDLLLNRTDQPATFPGFYTWATTQHPTKPFILAEWGIVENTVDATAKPKLFGTVLDDLKRYPAVKGMVYFDTAADQVGHDIRIDSSPAALAAFGRVAADPRFIVKIA